ncbi:MAG: SDR family oxidoreductase [Burkholderiales bacterium]|nr:SDR family oxidoreductase [Burkholderiales bacterium]
MNAPLAGRTAFITGAAQGLGQAIAAGLAQAGARVALADLDTRVADAAAALNAAGHTAIGLPLDVRAEAAFERAYDDAVGQLGEIGILVNNAALSPARSFWDISAAEWDDVLAVNLRGTFFGCRIAARRMRAAGWGRIINLSSLAGQQASSASGLHYAASKAAILALTRSLALELAGTGITVNAIAPSAIEGPALDRLDAARRDALCTQIPVGRFGLGREVAAAAVYLAADDSGYTTGATLDINGGRLMR